MWKEMLIERYFRSWLNQEIEVLESTFSKDVVYSECYGPEYQGIDQVLRWFTEWNKVGRVLEWRIKDYVHQNDKTVVEWYFCCDYNHEISGFDGVSIIKFDDNGKIEELREFQSKSEHYFPYGEKC